MALRPTRPVFVLLLAQLCSAQATTAIPSFTNPYVPSVSALIQDPGAPSTLYAGTADGVFKSANSGESWVRTSTGLPNSEILSLAIHPQTRLLYAGTRSGLYRSGDGAATWSLIEGLEGLGVAAIALDPRNAARMFVCGSGIHRSTDIGVSWTRVATFFVPCSRILLDPVNTETVYAIATQVGLTGPWVLKSTDGGTTWVQKTSGLPLGPRGPRVGHAIAIDPVSPSTLYVATPDGPFKTTDGAENWFQIPQGLPCSPAPLPVCPPPSAFAVDPINPARVYAGLGIVFLGLTGGEESRGFYRSNTFGAAWIASNTGIEGRLILSLLVDAANPSMLFAGTDRGVFRSEDAGMTWRSASEGLRHPERLRVLSGRFILELHASDPRTGRTAAGAAIFINDLFGYFALPGLTGNPDNPEVFVKMLDGRAVNGHFWVFYGGLTDLEYTLTVTDAFSLVVRTYHKDFGSPCGDFDTNAF